MPSHYDNDKPKKKRAKKWWEIRQEMQSGEIPKEFERHYKEEERKEAGKIQDPRSVHRKALENVKAVDKYFAEKWKTRALKKEIEEKKKKSKIKRLQAKGRKLRAKKK